MKRLLTLSALVLGIALTAGAQYAASSGVHQLHFFYSDFMPARVLMTDGKVYNQNVNISLRDGSLCYKQGDKIMAFVLKDIAGAVVGGTEFRKVGSQMGLVIESAGKNALVCVTTEVQGATRTELIGGARVRTTESSSGEIITLDTKGKNGNEDFDVNDEYYLLIGDKAVAAKKSKVRKMLAPEKAEAFDAMVRAEGWSWKKSECLKQLLSLF